MSEHLVMVPIPIAAPVGVVLDEIRRQDAIHEAGFPVDRDGVRLGLACIDNELHEALDAWREDRRTGDWTRSEGELTQLVAVGMRMLRSMHVARRAA